MVDSPSELNAEIEKLELKHADHPEGRFFVPLANAYRKAGDVEHAESLLREGLRRHPDYLSAHIVLGRCLADRGAMAEASEEFRYVLSVDPQNLIALRTLGELAVAGSHTDEAVRWYEELLGVDPMNEEARRALESLRQSGGKVGEEFRAGTAWWDADAESPTPERVEGADLPAAGEAARSGGYDPFSTGSVAGLESAEPALQDPPVAGEVVTETIAELYARQGLVERAAEVYRELIRRRGETPALQRRLAELEHQLGSATVSPPLPEPPPPPPAPLAPEPMADLVLDGEPEPFAPISAAPAEDPFATSFEHGFLPQDGSEPPPVEEEAETQAAAQAEVEPQPAGPGIAEFLRTLVRWRAGAEPRPAAEPAPAEPDLREPTPLVAGFAEPSALERLDAPEPPSTPAEEPGAARPPQPTAEAEPFPWEISAPAAPASPAAREEEPSDEMFSFDSFFNEAEAAPKPLPSAPAEPATEPAAEEDDDLESFQAWLRSLKR